MDQEPGIQECWIENIDDHPLQQYANSLEVTEELFIDDLQIAYDHYRKHCDWITLADEIWDSFTCYIGFREGSRPQSADEELIHQQFRKNAKSNFLSAIEHSFAEFYAIPKDHAVQTLTRFEEKLRANKDFDALSMTLTDGMRQKVDFLISRIQGEIRKQEIRAKGDLLKKTAADGEAFSAIKNFQTFCFEKIRLMSEEERERFLSITTGDRSFYDVGIKWKEEYNKISGKAPIRDHKTPLSNAKREYKEQRKS
jgi:hypothetical protein